MTVTQLPDRGRIDPAAWPLYPPDEWYAEPDVDSIPDDVYVHVVTAGADGGRVIARVNHWDTFLLKPGVLWTPPPSPSGLHDCQLGQTVTAANEILRTANIGGGVNHARVALGYREAVKHYENTASQLMRVKYYETSKGTMAVGAMWPDVTERDVLMVMSSALSGDWRYRPEYNEFDLTGSQLVNNPGLPLRRVASLEEQFDVAHVMAAAASGHAVVLGPGLCDGDDCCATCHVETLEHRIEDLEAAVAGMR